MLRPSACAAHAACGIRHSYGTPEDVDILFFCVIFCFVLFSFRLLYDLIELNLIGLLAASLNQNCKQAKRVKRDPFQHAV